MGRKNSVDVPRYIDVLTTRYKIEVVRGLSCDGKMDPYTQTIKIREKLTRRPEAFWRIFWHEVGHAFAEESGLTETLGAKSEEMFAQNFALWMVQRSYQGS